MQKRLHIKTTVLPEGKIEIDSHDLNVIINYDIKHRMGQEG